MGIGSGLWSCPPQQGWPTQLLAEAWHCGGLSCKLASGPSLAQGLRTGSIPLELLPHQGPAAAREIWGTRLPQRQDHLEPKTLDSSWRARSLPLLPLPQLPLHPPLYPQRKVCTGKKYINVLVPPIHHSWAQRDTAEVRAKA